MANNAIAIAREQEIFVIEETTKGTLIDPTAASLVIAAGYGSINQQPSFTNSLEIKNSRDVLERFADRTPPGSWSIPAYVRPSGSAGTAPDEGVLLKCLCGTETVTGGTSVAYTPALEKPSFSLWMKKGHTVFWARGCTVGSATIALSTTGGAMWNFSGQFMQMGWTGTDLIDGAASLSATSIPVDDGKKFTVGSLVEFVEGANTYSNSSAGYEVTAVSTNTLTITPGLEAALDDDSTIQGWTPTGTTAGTPLEARKGTAEFDTVATAVKSFEINFDDQPQYLVDEITTTSYPEAYVEVSRSINGSLSLYFRENDLQYFYDGYNSNQINLEMVVGDTAGSIMTIDFDQAELNVPEIAEADPTIALNMTFLALGSSGEDSYSVTFT